MISVVIPLYNKEKQIANTLNTVLHQTFHDFEIIIVNDGSTDNSVNEVNKIYDSRIRIIHQINSGVSVARNRGVKESKYDLIAFLDADDEWKPQYLETQYRLYLKYPECGVYACNYEIRNNSGRVFHSIIHKLPFHGTDGILTNYFEVASCSHPPICSISIMVKKVAIQSIGGFPLGVTHGEDLITWARLAIEYKIAYTTQICSIYIQGIDYGVNSRPINIPQDNIVGLELEKLLNGCNDKVRTELKAYIGRWYKIRSHLFLRGGEKINALINIYRVIKFKPREWKIYVDLGLLPFPTKFINYAFKKVIS